MQSRKTVDTFSLCKDIQMHGNTCFRFDIKVFLNMLQGDYNLRKYYISMLMVSTMVRLVNYNECS